MPDGHYKAREPGGRYTGREVGEPAPRRDDTHAQPADRWADAEAKTRRADTRPTTWDAEELTLEAAVATPHPVERRDSRGPFLEVLTVESLRIEGREVPVYDNHRSGGARETVGIVQGIRTEGETVVATLRLSAADDVLPLRQRVAEGTIRYTSVGYRVRGWRESTDAQGRRVKTPAAWTVTEVSLTPEPADPNARIRSHEKAPDDTARSGGRGSDPVNKRAASIGVTMSEDTTLEQDEAARRSEIRGLVRGAGLPPETADDLIDHGATVDDAKAALFDAVATRSRPTIRVHGETSPDNPETMRRNRAAALAHRAGVATDLPEPARDYAHASLLDHARGCLEAAGVSTRTLSVDETFHRAAHTTSDFPVVLQDLASMSAMQAFQYASSPLMQVSRQMTVSDFKAHKLVRLGEVGGLQEVRESGEIKAVSRAETGESISVSTYAARLDASRQLLINDSLGLFGDMAAELGRAAAAKQADLMHATLTSNPTLADGTAVFYNARGNTVTDNLDDPALNTARRWFRTMKGLDGQTLISAAPRYLVVGPDVEQEAEKLLASIAPATVANVNTWTDAFTLLVEPRLPGKPGDPEFVAAYHEAHAAKADTPEGTLQAVLNAYQDSPKFTDLAERTRRDYVRNIRLIEAEYGTFPLAAFTDRRTRGEFLAWRDRLAATRGRRQADYIFRTLAAILAWAADRGLVPLNPCERPGRLYRSTRAESIWSTDDEAAFLAVASEPMRLAFLLAVWTGQRQGDLLRLAWTAYDGQTIRLRQSKGGRRVVVPVSAPLRAALDNTPRRAVTILTNSRGHPWTADGFRTTWAKTVKKTPISGLTFHYLRGTAVTRLALAGASEAEIAAITGHSLRDVGAILDAHYLSRDARLAESGIRKLEAHGKRTENPN
ncbi:MAG: tyrosine-type recombinase/integrase [Paracoccaceae bacterium]|nr:tyrosine-type recombinase/integrase [Paracoccaceae bacterium]